MHEKTRGSFNGKLGFVMAAAGSAVGLGNILIWQQRIREEFSFSVTLFWH